MLPPVNGQDTVIHKRRQCADVGKPRRNADTGKQHVKALHLRGRRETGPGPVSHARQNARLAAHDHTGEHPQKRLSARNSPRRKNTLRADFHGLPGPDVTTGHPAGTARRSGQRNLRARTGKRRPAHCQHYKENPRPVHASRSLSVVVLSVSLPQPPFVSVHEIHAPERLGQGKFVPHRCPLCAPRPIQAKGEKTGSQFSAEPCGRSRTTGSS